MTEKTKIQKTDAEWQKQLTPEQFQVARKAGTEPAFTGKYWKTKDAGTYTCACCGEPLFSSETKFDSGTGWPSFYKAVDQSAVEEKTDSTYGMVRTEARCAKCDRSFYLNSVSLRNHNGDLTPSIDISRGGIFEIDYEVVRKWHACRFFISSIRFRR